MMDRKRAVGVVCLGILFVTLGTASRVLAQSRVNDRDIENLMRNLRDDAKSFQPVFNDSIKHSIIRKTSREKDAKSLVASFVKQTNGMLDTFKRTKKADNDLANVLDTATRINRTVYAAKLNPQTVSRWEKVRSELHQVAAAYGIQDPLYQEAPAAELAPSADARSMLANDRQGTVAALSREVHASLDRHAASLRRAERVPL